MTLGVAVRVLPLFGHTYRFQAALGDGQGRDYGSLIVLTHFCSSNTSVFYSSSTCS